MARYILDGFSGPNALESSRLYELNEIGFRMLHFDGSTIGAKFSTATGIDLIQLRNTFAESGHDH